MAPSRRSRSHVVLSGEPGPRARHHEVRVLYADTDKAQVVHHARYLEYLEGARIGYLRDHGLDYRAFEEQTGLGLPVVAAELRYRAPARFDDVLDVETWIGLASSVKVVFESRIRRGEEILVEAAITVACVDLRAGRVTRVHEAVRAACVE